MIRQFSTMVCLLALGAALALSFTPPVSAQVLYGSIVGNVTDATGAVVPGADVTITHKETNQTRQTLTNEAGTYSFPTVASGTYTVKVALPGFKESIRTDVPVAVNNVARVDLTLQVGEVTESLTVSSESTPLLQTDSAEVQSEVSAKQLENLPVPLGRNYQALFETLPGFSTPEDAHSIQTNPSRSLVFNVNGASRSSNNTRIDGASSTNVWVPHVTAYVPSLESIEVVNVTTNSFDAEQGLAGGAAISVKTKSGTNNLHGSLFEYHHNNRLRARNFFRPLDQPKGKFIYNQWGATVGGPIIKDRLFYFVSYEGTADRRNEGRTGSVPTLAVRNGDFSGFTTRIYDPATGNPNGTGRLQFPGNKIPDNRKSPITQKIIALIPLPNLPNADGTFPENNNYFNSAPYLFDRWTVDSKGNWNINEKVNMFARFSVLNFNVTTPTFFGPVLEGAGMGAGNTGTGDGKTYNWSVGANWIASPRIIVDANFGFVRMISNSEHPSIGKNYGLDVLGIPGTNGPKRFQSGFPRFDVSGYDFYGSQDHFMPYYRNDDQFQYVVNATWTQGKHEVRWGMDLYHQAMNHTQPEFTGGNDRGPRGRFAFGTGPTRLCTVAGSGNNCTTLSSSSNTVNAFGSFLLGLTTQLGKNLLTVTPYTTRNWQYSFYLRDRWQIHRKLTFTYGTRFEYFPMPTRADRGLENYNPETNKIEIGGVGSIPENLGVDVGRGQFAPRFGLAYRPTKSFVIRAGYGLTHDPYSLARPLRTNHPVLIGLNVNAPASHLPAANLSQGVPEIVVPSLGNGIIDIPGNVQAFGVPKQFRRGYLQSWNLTLQKELLWGFVGEAGYVATRQIRQLGFTELNWTPIGGGTAGRQLQQKFGRAESTRIVTPIGGSNYNAMQARLQRRFSGGYAFGANYTWGKAIGYANNSDDTLPIQIPQYYHLNRRVAGFDRSHNLQITNITELPFGRGKNWVTEGFLSKLAGGWQVNSILSFTTGTPFTVSASGTSLNAPGNSQRADQINPEVKILGGIGRGQSYFDPTAFAAVNDARFGTSGFNSLRGPGYANWKFGLFRNFKATERVNVQFRAEAFNFTNTPHFRAPGANVSNLQFEPDGTTIRNLNGFTEVTSSYGEREFRFGLRIGF
ncbi:MAG: TonB-dependent receptor domain-containing protein [Acidobacteriota bacterium]